MSVSNAVFDLKKEMHKSGIIQENGIGEELFLFSSTIVPIVNVDLLIFDKNDKVLLSQRDDKWCGTGWHLPGSCIRFDETIHNAISRCAFSELGLEVIHTAEPLKVYDVHFPNYREGLEDQRERKHFIALAYGCYAQNEYDLYDKYENDGCIRWFRDLPKSFLQIHDCYRNDWLELKERLKHSAMYA